MERLGIRTALASAVLIAVTGCGDLAAIDEESAAGRDFPFTGTALAIENSGAELRLVGGPAGTIGVDRTLTGKATRDGNARWSMDDGTLRLSVTCSGIVPDCGGRYVVHVPPGVAIEVASAGGPVRAVKPGVDLTASVTDGWLRVEEPGGRLRLRADNAVEVTGARSADVVARSTEGGVTLSFAAAPRRVEARADIGAVTVTVPDGPETYRLAERAGTGSIPSDPSSARVITAVAGEGRASRVRRAG
ncbi:hypothetical protein [Plantactinospora sp. GCM10030261]|uniref:hypothetical protein n=1 Tax=Plantactinospora sp. GCM10030261 TaxID=3273420 RepID=UPI0036091D92